MIKIPILCIHGDQDEVTPPQVSEDIVGKKKQGRNRELLIIKGGSHEGLWLFKDIYYPSIRKFINKH